MLRLAVLILLLANAGYYAFNQGWLAPWGYAPAAQGEPERLTRQIAPESLHILPADHAAPAAKAAEPEPAPAPAPTSVPAPDTAAPAPATMPAPDAHVAASSTGASATSCLQAGPMNDARASALRAALAALPEGSWTLEASEIPGRWMVYMGRFPDEETVAKKRAELRELKVSFDRPGAAFEPGLSLGRFPTEEQAQRGLADLASHGIRTARVVQERTTQTRHMLRLPAATDAMRSRITALAFNWGDTPLQACK